MHRVRYSIWALAVALAAASAGSVATVARALAHPLSSPVVGHVYVDDNTAGTNTIAGFNRHADGILSPLPGSPFSAGGAGTGTIIGSQGPLQLASDGQYLLAVDAGSNQISVLRIRPDGALRLVENSPVASGGIEPISIAVHDSLVYVANTGNGTEGANYTGFILNLEGRLTPLAGSTFPLPADSGPGEVLFNARGTRLAGTRVNTSLIDSFVVGDEGRLTAAAGSPYSAQATGPFGSAFRPTDSSQLFISNAHAGAGNGSVSAFADGRNGVLTSIGTSPYPDFQTAPCWVGITPDGQYLFAVNTGSGSISRYAIAADGTLTLLGSTPFQDASGLRPFELQVDATESYAYVVDGGGHAVSTFRVQGGTLTELSSSPFALPSGATPFGIAVD
jgi:6-phosphogluconolactonase